MGSEDNSLKSQIQIISPLLWSSLGNPIGETVKSRKQKLGPEVLRNPKHQNRL